MDYSGNTAKTRRQTNGIYSAGNYERNVKSVFDDDVVHRFERTRRWIDALHRSRSIGTYRRRFKRRLLNVRISFKHATGWREPNI